MYTPTSILPARIVRSLKGSKRASKKSSVNEKPTATNKPLSPTFEADEGNSCFDDFEEITYDEVPPDLDHETSTLDTRSLSPLSPRQVPEISSPFALSYNKPDNPRLHHPRSKSVSHTLPELSLSRSHSRSSLPLLYYSRQSQSRSRVDLAVASTESLLSEFPQPPTHVPISYSRHITIVDPPSAPGGYFLVKIYRSRLISYLLRFSEASSTETGFSNPSGPKHTASVSTFEPSFFTIYYRTVRFAEHPYILSAFPVLPIFP